MFNLLHLSQEKVDALMEGRRNIRRAPAIPFFVTSPTI